ncbi:RNA polymerase sigma factor [Pseudoalteromonas sp. NEC-BIFX-2020_002]|uniref:RNA polymerase sigma factor n=1 Tax=Pseudoalteromonas neustonica TaxID=1840331 RepID=A0ABU9U3C6_9GAMM|nr:RNA polymerase sigma factor [Pseudoalteromonas sp. NEC-BIFX-2020_002]NNG43155.1 RNA polymerase sigma factor [Pseudoalteromonas sp. NEC-BIFX-2020_002]
MNSTQITLTVINAQQGDELAFNSLCNCLYKPSFLFAMKLSKQTDLAKDITQEAWAVVAKDIRKLKEPSVFKAWLFRVVYHKFIDTTRQSRGYESFQPDKHEQTRDITSSNEQSIDLLKLINNLPDSERHSIYLFYLEQMSISDIALITDVAVGTVKSRLHRARAQLAVWLNE